MIFTEEMAINGVIEKMVKVKLEKKAVFFNPQFQMDTEYSPAILSEFPSNVFMTSFLC